MTVHPPSLRELVNAGVHFGHVPRRWNPKMRPYLYGVRNGVHILDLDQTLPMFSRALVFAHDIAAKSGRILFIGTKRQISIPIAETAKRCGQYYVNQRWLGGMLTNWDTIAHSIKRLRTLDEKLETPPEAWTKKELLDATRKREKLQRSLGGIRDMGARPDALIIIDTNKEKIAVQEAVLLKIPVIAVIDSNSDPSGIDFPIPGNDDARRAIDLYCAAFERAIIEGLQDEQKRHSGDRARSSSRSETPRGAQKATKDTSAEDTSAGGKDATVQQEQKEQGQSVAAGEASAPAAADVVTAEKNVSAEKAADDATPKKDASAGEDASKDAGIKEQSAGVKEQGADVKE